jgi:hypothetical protein
MLRLFPLIKPSAARGDGDYGRRQWGSKARSSPPGSPTRPSGGLDAHRRRNGASNHKRPLTGPLERLRGAGSMARPGILTPECRVLRETRQRTRTSFPFTAGRSGVRHLSVHSILCDVSESFAGRSRVNDPAPLSRLPTPSVGCVGCVGLRHMKDARWGPAFTKSPERARRWNALPFDSPTSSSPRLR